MMLLTFLYSFSRLACATAISLAVSGTTPAGSSIAVDRKFLSISIDILAWPYYIGTRAAPNTYTLGLLQYLADNNGGMYPEFRLGSNNQETFIWDSSLTKYATDLVNLPGFTSDWHRMGPTYVDSLKMLPDSATFVIGIGLSNQNYTNVAAMVSAFLGDSTLQSRITAFDLGNEPDMWGGIWTGSFYSSTYINYIQQIYQTVIPKTLSVSRALFAGGSTANCHAGDFAATQLITGTMGSKSMMQSWSCHQYPQNLCKGGVTLAKMLSHSSLTTVLDASLTQVQPVLNAGLTFVFGEANSVSCGGQDGVSNVFGSALWGVNFMLYSAAHSVTRIFLHTTPWNFYQIYHASSYPAGTSPGVYPLYYSYLLVSQALGSSSNVKVASLGANADNPDIVSYALYDNERLSRMVVLNLAMHLTTSTSRASYNLAIPSNGFGAVIVSVLDGPGVDSYTGTSFDGYSYESGAKQSTAPGNHYTVAAQNNMFNVAISEGQAVLLTFSNSQSDMVAALTSALTSTRAGRAGFTIAPAVTKTSASSAKTPSTLTSATKSSSTLTSTISATSTSKAAGRPGFVVAAAAPSPRPAINIVARQAV